MRPQQKRWIGGALAALALVMAVAIAAGIGYEQVARRQDRGRFPQVGRSVDIGGRTLNIFCSGDGSPAVILESDVLSPGYGWVFIQREIAKVTRACWYDRAGYGWSDPGPAPHSSSISARDLHGLLGAAGLRPPYLLVGAGFGSWNVRVYNGLYPGDVAGSVMLDPIPEDEERMGMASRVPFQLGYPPDVVLRAVGGIGLMRLMSRGNRRRLPPKGLTPDEQATLIGLEGQPKMQAAFLAEQGFSSSIAEVRAAAGFGDRPVIVLRSEASIEPDLLPHGSQKLLANLSSNGRLVEIADSDHDIQREAPDAAIGAVRDLVAELRGKR